MWRFGLVLLLLAACKDSTAPCQTDTFWLPSEFDIEVWRPGWDCYIADTRTKYIGDAPFTDYQWTCRKC